MKNIDCIINEKNQSGIKASTDFLSKSEISKVVNFHSKFEAYAHTPLLKLDRLAEKLGVREIWVKDESFRFGLNAFKVLGGAYAIGKFLAEKLEVPIDELSFEKLKSKAVREKLGAMTFVTATDGNHGRGVAWAAKELGQKAVVYMPKGSAKRRLDAILETGAEGYITDLNYDDAVRLAAENAQKYGWIVVQDTAWEGYEKIPMWILQGYAAIAYEIEEKPTHLILQAGVGSFAGAILGYYSDLYGKERPITMIVEPENAACIYKSAGINDGKPYGVTGDLNTMMAGLACGEPNPIGWNILRDYGHAYFSCSDYVSARGMRILANPLGDDAKIVSGESGAVGMGLLSILLTDEKYKDIVEKLYINESSKVLIISTEGDTDPENYYKVLWD